MTYKVTIRFGDDEEWRVYAVEAPSAEEAEDAGLEHAKGLLDAKVELGDSQDENDYDDWLRAGPA